MMDRFEYKVLKKGGIYGVNWFDGKENVGHEIDAALLNRYGDEGWEVAATMQTRTGWTHKIILKRRKSAR